MTPAAQTLRFAWRDPARHLAPMLPLFSVLLFLISPPSRAPYWIGLLILPIFFISTALTVPTFSEFELALPVTRTQLLWSRIVASLGMLWLAVLTGIATMLLVKQPFPDLREPVAFAAFFTACACLATSARVSPRRLIERVSWLLASLCGLLALLSLPWQGALAIACVAAVPVLARLWWTFVPEWHRRTSISLPAPIAASIWPLIKLLFSWQTLAVAPLAFLVGRNLSWTCLPFAGLFLMTVSARQRCLLALPVSRRSFLLARLLPVLALLLAGIAFGYRAGHLTWTSPAAYATSGSSDWRSYTGNPPGLDVPLDYYQRSVNAPPPEIVAPWGETAQPHGQWLGATLLSSQFAYNPYFVAPRNSDRFFEWQFGRATRAIYGQALRPDELAAAIRAGLKPLTEQPRMEILSMAFGAAAVLTLALLFAMSQWHYLRHIPSFLRGMLKPLRLPLLSLFALTFFISAMSSSYDPVAARVQPLLFHLSAILPTNLACMTLALLAPLATLYWALEKVFNHVEFPDRPKETK
jgi:hypothetical protein